MNILKLVTLSCCALTLSSCSVFSSPFSCNETAVDGCLTIEAVNATTRRATIRHDTFPEIGMPGMTMDFDLNQALAPETLPIGHETTLTFERPDGMTMVLISAEATTPPIEVSGTINAIDTVTGMANITHGPITDIGMPGMTMDFAVASTLGASDLPIGQDLTLLMTRNANLSLTIVGVVSSKAVGQ